MARISKQGLDFIKSFESFVPYVYDDLRAPVKGKYREWDGGACRGTLTIGYGHTNSAKHPLKISRGLKITEAEACEILDVDLDECEEAVNADIDAPLTQGQFDALVSFAFNCGAGNMRKLAAPLEHKDYAATRRKFDLYVKSKGQYLRGLQRRRDGEQAMWDDNDVLLPTEPVHHTAEVDAPAKATVTEAPESVSIRDLVHVSRKASLTANIKRAWKGFTIASVLSYLVMGKETYDQVSAVIADHWLAIVITTALLTILAIKGIEALMVEDVKDGRALPSGAAA